MASDDAVTGAIGEKLVCIELLKRRINFWEMKERNPVFDIIIEQNDKLKKIQVKTSRGANGYAYSMGNSRKYDYIVLVGIKDESNPEFHIIPVDELTSKKGINGSESRDKYSKFKNKWEILK